MSEHTPMMKQYLSIKKQYEDAFLFFRLGDFYELFYDDAIKAARELEITLTQRDPGRKKPIPMCGVPHHSAERYIKTLVDKGYKVAICEQVEDPQDAVGVVKREVVQVITPGTVMEKTMLDDKESNYISSLSHFPDGSFVIVYNELSTGETKILLITSGWETVLHELFNQSVKEIVIASTLPKQYVQDLEHRLQMTISYEDEVNFNAEYRPLCENLTDERLLEAFSRLLNYIQRTQKRSVDHLQRAEIIELNNYLTLDMYSKRNLELTETILQKDRYGSLLWLLDETNTAMGSRLLKQWIERPLIHETAIQERLNIVSALYEHFIEREHLREALKSVYDLERLTGRVSFGNVNARDLLQLKKSLQQIPNIKNILQSINDESIKKIEQQLDYPEEIVTLLEQSIAEEPPISITEGSIIKDGYDVTLDQYRDASRNGKKWIAELEQQEKEITNIRSLKIKYNRVFGYFIEVTNPNLHLIPEGRYERKQTLTNSERFITPELKEKEQLILEAEEKSIDLEYKLFLEIREQIKTYTAKLQTLAHVISQLDVLQSFASVSEQNGYTCPTFAEGHLMIKNGRHPVVEQVMQDGQFVPNDITLNDEKKILLITGPNMSGKSTYMRQLALTAIMGQIGCFVPADEAQLLIFDQIFTRIGAADDLVAGQSTFMVEMLEAKHALTYATSKSLILLDEIGRGTSTYDGMALAQAIVEYIHDHIHAKTLFSTHYHELTTLEKSLPRLKNIHVRAEEHDDKIVFLHKVQDGASDESYGVHVAQLAELPPILIERAKEILTQLENGSQSHIEENLKTASQLSFFEPVQVTKKEKNDPTTEKILKTIKELELMDMTPLEAMNELYRLQKLIRKKKG
ncbi:MAG TPA: DNA mismatch repair protein MutS [Bacillota bacterium]|nr:DNA mismatch repair protein MutS [Bacillota bacterium]